MTLLCGMLFAVALAIAFISKGRKTGLAFVIGTFAVAMAFWYDNFSTGDKWLFWPLVIACLIYTSGGRFRTGTRVYHDARIGAGLAFLMITAVLATTWDIRPDFDTVAAEAVSTTVPVTVTVLPSTTDADGNTEDVPIVQETATDDTVTDESSTEDPAIPPTVTCDQGGTIAEMVACIEKAPNKAEIVKYLDANEIGILGNDEAGTTWERLAAYPADLDSRVILVLNAPDVTDAEVRAVAAKTMGELAERAKIVRREGVVLVNSYIDPATGEVKSYADARKQIRTITTFADTGKEALVLAYNGQGILGRCLNGSKGVIIKEKVRVETRVETRTITQTVNTTSTANSTATVSAPAVTQTATSTSTASGPAVTTTVTATTSPTPGKTATITLPAESRTTTATATASAEPGPTVTVVGPGATATVTSTATATVPGPATTVTATATVPGPGVTITSSGGSTATVPGPTVTVTSTSTVTAPPLPGKTATITLPAEKRTITVTEPAEPGPTVTHTITVTAQPEQTGEPNDP